MRAGAPYIMRTHDSGKDLGSPLSMAFRLATRSKWSAKTRNARDYSMPRPPRGVFVSHDDGDHWESLQLNLPHTIVSDLDVHGDDLVASTHGRSLWILDGLTPIREDVTENAALPAGHRDPRALGQQSGHPLPTRDARGREPARRSDPRLLPEDGSVRTAQP